MTSILEESKKARGGSLLRLSKKKIIVVIIIAIAISTYFYFQNLNSDKITEIVQKEWSVKTGDLKISLENDGKVVAEDGVELSFSVTGDTFEILEVFVSEGQTVARGDKIASIKVDDLQYDLNKAYASYNSALANYNDKLDGATDEEKARSQNLIEQAVISLEQSKISLEKTELSTSKSIINAENDLRDAVDKLEDNQDELSSADVREAYEDLVTIIKSVGIVMDNIIPDSDDILGIDNTSVNDDFEALLGAKNYSYLNDSKSTYYKIKGDRTSLNSYIINLSKDSNYYDIDIASDQAELALNDAEEHLYNMQNMLENTITSSSFSQSELNSFKSTINTNRNSVGAKITSLVSGIRAVESAKDSLDDYVRDYEDAIIDLENAKKEAEQDISTANTNISSKEISLRQAEISYDELVAPASASDLANARSQLTTAGINVDKARNDLEKATIFSPIDGEVVLLNYKTGDIVLKDSSEPVVEIINNNTLFIEVDIEEADINKININQVAYITFDSIEGLELKGEVNFISLTAKTDNNGIVTYQVKILIDNHDEIRIREGMTAFVDFITAEAKNVIIIPVNAVRNINGAPSVEVISGEIKSVVTGFTDGKNVEVISGLEKGEKILY